MNGVARLGAGRSSGRAVCRWAYDRAMTFDIAAVRDGFPALGRTLDGRQVAYLDGPGGTQMHASVIDAMAGFMTRGGSNTHGHFAASFDSEAVVDDARDAVADLFGAQPNEILFGQNMTSLTYAMSRALARTWSVGDNIVLTRLDHDANVAPWMQAAHDALVGVRFVDFDPSEGCNLDLSTLDLALDERTRLVAFTHASNAVGTITPVASIVERAHSVGALTYVDAVHFAPHGLIDVAETGTDFLVASAYKFFGPHTGCLFGRDEILSALAPYKLRPAPDASPDKWETGTQSFESLVGVTAAVDYIASLGSGSSRREKIVSAYSAISAHERNLANQFLAGVESLPHVTLYGQPTATGRSATFAVEVDGISSDTVAERLGERGCFVWAGDYYAYEVMHRLDRGAAGLVRIGFVHYNTEDEVERVLGELDRLA